MFSGTPSLADIATVTKDNDGMFGSNGSWLFAIIILAVIFGWGNNGWGANGSAGAIDNYVLNSDFSTLSRQIDSGFDGLRQQSASIANGICSLGYDQLAQFNGINTNVLSTTNALQNTINENSNALQAQLSQCCCQNRYDALQNTNSINNSLADIKYTMATDTCAVTTNANNNTRDIVDSQNAGTQAILAKLSAMESNAKDEKIAQLTAMNTDLRFQASQNAQNNVLINTLRPSPIPAYAVANPYGCNCGMYGYGTTIA